MILQVWADSVDQDQTAVWSRSAVMFLSFRNRQAWANSVDPDQSALRGAVWSESTLFAIPSASFVGITLS